MARPFPYTPPSQRSGGADLNQQQRLAPEKAAVRSDLAEEQDIVEYWKGLAIYPDPPPVAMVLESGSSVGISTARRVSVSLSVIVADLG